MTGFRRIQKWERHFVVVDHGSYKVCTMVVERQGIDPEGKPYDVRPRGLPWGTAGYEAASLEEAAEKASEMVEEYGGRWISWGTL